MPVEIASDYFSNLERIKSLVLDKRIGGWQEFPEVFELESERGTCCYDRCCDKRKKANKEIRMVYENGKEKERKEESYFFHIECLEKLLKDKRLNVMN